MIALLGSVFTASLLGSLHCAGMCGPIAAAASGSVSLTVDRRAVAVGREQGVPTDGGRSSDGCSHGGIGIACRSQRPAGAYHLGRLLVYVALGTAAGALGGTFDLAGTMVGVSRPAAVIAGALLIAGGALALGAHVGLRTPKGRMGGSLSAVLPAIHRRLGVLSPTLRALLIGGLSGLLPCGWLWAFVLLAAATSDPLTGGAVMGAFWLGTVPAVAGAALGLGLLAWPVRRHAPILSAVAMLAIGLLAVSGRVILPEIDRASKSDSASAVGPADCPLCDHGDGKARVLPVELPVPSGASASERR